VVRRVANHSNTITWTYTSGDPTPVSIVITNSVNSTLNGLFFIAEFVNVVEQASMPLHPFLTSIVFLCVVFTFSDAVH